MMWSIDKIRDAAGSQFFSAVTHSSYARHYHGTKSKIPPLARRGDKILSNVVAEYRAQEKKKGNKKLPGNPEFESAFALFPLGIALGIHDAIRMSREHKIEFFERVLEENLSKHTMRVVTEPIEALIAAIEHHSGYETAKEFVYENIIIPITIKQSVDVESLIRASKRRYCIFL